MTALLRACLCCLLLSAMTAQAAPLDPNAFTSLGSFNPGSNVSVNTDTLAMSGGATFTGVTSGNIAVFTFTTVNLSAGITITVTGSRAFALLSRGTMSIAGTVDVSASGNTRGAGGHNGNASSAGGFGSGPGAGGGDSQGGGGAGFGNVGGSSSTGSIAGPAYGNLAVLLEGGSGGGRGTFFPTTSGAGGGGGGALELGALGSLTLQGSAVLRANGGNGANHTTGSDGDGGGGGSGGGLYLHGAPTDLLSGAQLRANGGNGGNGRNGVGGGGGAGGRIRVEDIGVNAATVSANGGTGSAIGGFGTGFNGGNGEILLLGPPGVSVVQSGGSTNVTEGGAIDTYTLVLTSPPSANVSVALNPGAQLTATPSPVVFTPGNFATPQTVTVAAVDDTAIEGPHLGTITHSVSSSDGRYNNLVVPSVSVNITDNDQAALAINDVSISEGNTGSSILSFTVTRTGTTSAAAGFTYGTVDNGATAGSDYATASGTGSIPGGGSSGSTTVNVTINGDAVFENNESFFVNLSAPTNATIADGQGVGTIVNDDTAPALTINDVSVVEGNSGTSSLLFIVTRTGPTELPATFIAATADSTATAPSDYLSALTGSTSIAPGGASATTTLTATINGDVVVESNESFFVNLSAPNNASIADNQGIGTINNDDVAGIVLVQSGGNTVVAEGGATDNYTLVLTSQPTANVSIALTGTQVTATPTPLVFTSANWNLPQEVTVTAIDDAQIEGNHTGSVSSTVTSADSNYSSAILAAVPVAIVDNDSAGVSITQSGGSTAVTEGGATDNYTVLLTSQPVGDVVITPSGVQVGVSPSSLTFTVSNWNLPQTVTVAALDDNSVEGPHTGSIVHAVTSSDANYNGISIDGVPGIGITDNDSATVQFSPISVSQSEAISPMVFTVTLSNPVASGVTLTVNSTPGTATSPADFAAISGGTVTFAPNSTTSQTVNVVIANESLFEGNETYSLTLSSLVATGNVTLPPGTATATGTIANDDAAPTITISAPSVVEGNPPTSTPLNFVVSLNTASGLPVNFNYATNGATGTATAGTDYTAVPSTAGSIAAGQLSVTLPVTVLGDVLSEGNETVVLDLSTIGNANVTTLSGTGTINDDDIAQITLTDAGLTEGDSGSQNLQFTVSRSGNGGAFSVDFATSNATATAGSDYTSTTGTLTFTANGAPSQVINVPITGESLVEVTETFTVTLSNVVNTLGTAAIDDGSGTGTITDNDSATVQFAPTSVSQSEATSPMAFTVTLSNPVQSGVTLTVNSTPGTATSPADFTAISGGTVSFAPNSNTAQTVNVVIANDALDEDDEQFTLTLSSLTATGNVTLPIATATATGTIQDDDALPVLSVANVSQAEGNSGTTTMTFTVNLTPVSGRAVSFTRATTDGSAVSIGAAPDFVALAAAPVTIAAGQSSASIAVTINGDAVFEGDQQFTLDLSAVGNATPGSLSAVGTIVDDDQQPTTTTISSDQPDPSLVGQPYTVAVVVRGQSSSPSGTISISDGSASCGPVALTPSNSPESTASCSLTSTSAGNKTLTASYTPANTAFAPSSGTTAHRVDAASTRLSVTGPARVRIDTAATYSIDLGVIAPGGGTPTGTVTVSSGANSCTIALPATSCNLSFSTLGSRTISASYPGNGDYLGSNSSGAGNAGTVVFALSDVEVTKTDGREFYAPGDLIVYTIQVRNLGPDIAENIRLQDTLPAGLSAGQWSCDASGGASCAQNAGTGNLDQLIPLLPRTGLLNYTLFANVVGSPGSISNSATLVLPADATIDDPQSANNSATDVSILDRLFENGFEAPSVNGPSGSFVLPGLALRGALDPVAISVYSLADSRGPALRVYARLWNGEVEYALAIRDGAKLRLGAWQRHAGEPTLRWTATQVAEGWVLQSAAL